MWSPRPSPTVGPPDRERWSSSSRLDRSTSSRTRSTSRRLTADYQLPVRADHAVAIPPPASTAARGEATVNTTAGSTAAFRITSRTTCRSAATDGGAFGGLEDPQLERTFRGHHGEVTAVSFSPDMKRLVSASTDRCLVLWSFRPQLRAIRFKGHTASVQHAEFSHDGLLIASASRDRTVRLWTPSARGGCSVIKGHMGGVRHVSFSRNGRLLITASEDKTVKIWSLPSQKFMCTLTGHNNWVRCATFSPDSRLAVSCGDDKTVRLWDVSTQDCLHTFFDHDRPVGQAKFHPDGTCVASCSADKTIKIWDARSHQLLQHYPAHDLEVTSISFHESGNFLLSSSADATLKIWDLREGRLLYTIKGHAGPATAAAFTRDGTRFASGGADGIVLSWKSNLSERFGLDGNESSAVTRETRPRAGGGAGGAWAAGGGRKALSARTTNARVSPGARPSPRAPLSGMRRPGGYEGLATGGGKVDRADVSCRRGSISPTEDKGRAILGGGAYNSAQQQRQREPLRVEHLADSRTTTAPPAVAHGQDDGGGRRAERGHPMRTTPPEAGGHTAPATGVGTGWGTEPNSAEAEGRAGRREGTGFELGQGLVGGGVVVVGASGATAEGWWGLEAGDREGMRGKVGIGRGEGGQGSLDRRDLPKGLNAALEEIVTQMDTLTQAMGMVEQRLCVIEDRVASSMVEGEGGGRGGGVGVGDGVPLTSAGRP